MIRYTAGPFDLFVKYRESIGIVNLPVLRGNEIIDYKESIETPDRFITKLVSCFWCFTTWITCAVCVIYGLLFHVSSLSFPFLWFASAGLSAFLHEVIEG